MPGVCVVKFSRYSVYPSTRTAALKLVVQVFLDHPVECSLRGDAQVDNKLCLAHNRINPNWLRLTRKTK